MAKNVKRRQFLAGAGAVATTAVAGCSGGESDDDGTSSTDGDGTSSTDDGSNDGTDMTSTEGGELQLAQGPLATLDPIAVQGARADWMNFMLFESLFTYEDGTTPPVGGLATDYELSEDYLTYTFTLKEGVTFHNGSELTADDVVYSWRRLAESENNRNSENFIVGNIMNVAHDETEDGDIVPDSMALEAVDDYTVEMTLETPFQSVIGHLTGTILSVVPEGIVGDIEGYEGEYDYEQWLSTEATGTGPFELEEWNRGSEVVVTAFDDYHGSTANIDSARSQIVEDPNAQYTLAVNEQNVDVFNIPRSQFDPNNLTVEEELDDGRQLGTYDVDGETTVNYGSTSLPRTQYLIFHTLNVEKPVRQAFAYLINQDALTRQATKGLGKPAYFITPPTAFPGGGTEQYDELASSEYPYGYNSSEIQTAQDIMEEAGYGPDNRYETSMMYPSDAQASQWETTASYMRDLAQSAYIDLSLESAPNSTLTNRAIDGNFDIYGVYNALAWMEADATLQYAYPNPYTWTRWGRSDEPTDASENAREAWSKYEENRVPTDEAQQARNEAYLDIERANWEDVTELPLWHPTDQVYWWDWVQDFRSNGPMSRPKFNDVSLGDRP